MNETLLEQKIQNSSRTKSKSLIKYICCICNSSDEEDTQVSASMPKVNSKTQPADQYIQDDGDNLFKETDSHQQLDAFVKLPQSFIRSKSKKDYLKNKIFFLTSHNKKKSVILARITEKQMKYLRKGNIKDQNERNCSILQSIVANLEGSFHADLLEPDQQTPLLLAKYEAQRISGASIVVDLCCGSGTNTSSFAKECEFIIGIDNDHMKLEMAQRLCETQKIDEKVNFLLADCLKVKLIGQSIDVVFINPSMINRETEYYDITRDCQPPLEKCIELAFQISQNIMIQLPYNIDLQCIPQIFEKALICSKVDDTIQNYQIEIEEISFDQKPQYYIIYYGKIAQFSNDETLEYLNQFLIRQGSDYSGLELKSMFLNLLHYVQKKIGIYRIVQMSYQVQRQSTLEQTILQQFISNLISLNIIEEEVLRKCVGFNLRNSSLDYTVGEIEPSATKKAGMVSFQSNNEQTPSILHQRQNYITTKQLFQSPQTPYNDKLISPNEFSLGNDYLQSASYRKIIFSQSLQIENCNLMKNDIQESRDEVDSFDNIFLPLLSSQSPRIQSTSINN